MGTRRERSVPRTVRRAVTSAVEYLVGHAGTAVVRALDRCPVGRAHRPRDVAGHVTGWVFAHRPSDRRCNSRVVSLLGVRRTGRVLEIGSGPGVDRGTDPCRRGPRVRRRPLRGDAPAGLPAQRRRRPARAGPPGPGLRRAAAARLRGPLRRRPGRQLAGVPARTGRAARRTAPVPGPGGRIALASQPRCPGAPADTAREATRTVEGPLRAAGFPQPSTRLLPLNLPRRLRPGHQPGCRARRLPRAGASGRPGRPAPWPVRAAATAPGRCVTAPRGPRCAPKARTAPGS